MSTAVIANHLTLRLTPPGGPALQAECQVIDLTFREPSMGEPTIVFTACPGGAVSDPGDPVNGSLSGNVFADFGPAGISRMLVQAKGQTVDYDLVLNADDEAGDGSQTVRFTGQAMVQAVEIPWVVRKAQRHPIALSVTTATPTFDVTTP